MGVGLRVSGGRRVGTPFRPAAVGSCFRRNDEGGGGNEMLGGMMEVCQGKRGGTPILTFPH